MLPESKFLAAPSVAILLNSSTGAPHRPKRRQKQRRCWSFAILSNEAGYSNCFLNVASSSVSQFTSRRNDATSASSCACRSSPALSTTLPPLAFIPAAIERQEIAAGMNASGGSVVEGAGDDRQAHLEAEVASLRREVNWLTEELAKFKKQFE